MYVIFLDCIKVCLNIQKKILYFSRLAFSGIFTTNGIFVHIPKSYRNQVFVFVSQSSKTMVKSHLASKQKFIFVFLLSLNVIQDSHYTCASARLIRVNKCCTDPKGRRAKIEKHANYYPSKIKKSDTGHAVQMD